MLRESIVQLGSDIKLFIIVQDKTMVVDSLFYEGHGNFTDADLQNITVFSVVYLIIAYFKGMQWSEVQIGNKIVLRYSE